MSKPRTFPPLDRGAFNVSELSAVTSVSQPTDGIGGHETAAADTLGKHWLTLGYTLGTFDVLIESIQVNTPGGVNNVAISAVGDSHVYVVGNSSGAISVPMKDGFTFTSGGTGFTIQYRILSYSRPST